MTDRARRLLDNLLGVNRNTIQSEEKTDYCIYYLAGGCPYELLKNTKLSLGPCKYKVHEFIDSTNKILYEQELLKILSGILEGIDKKIEKASNLKDDKILESEQELELKIIEIEQNITEENVLEMYNKFQSLEVEIFNLEKIKETFSVKNKDEGLERCNVCGMSILKNFCSQKYIGHVEGRAHNGMRQLRKLHHDLRNKGI